MTGTKPGPAPKPALAVVKEGNPGKRPVRPEVKLPPGIPDEPSWVELFPLAGNAQLKAEMKRCRKVAGAAWKKLVGTLDAHGLLTQIDWIAVEDACVCYAQLQMANRNIARRGLTITTEHGEVRNAAVTAAAQFRTALKNYIANLGLSPAARVGLVSAWDKGAGTDDDDVFD